MGTSKSNPSIWSRVWTFTLKYPLAIVGTILLGALAVCLAAFGRRIQIGGLLGALWGKGDGADPNVRVLPPQDRVDGNGKPIPVGESDEKGWVQAPINTVIKEPGIFSDPSVLVVEHPDKGEVRIPLPEGVRSEDVKQVVEVAPNVYEVRNNDKGVDAGKLLKELEG